MIGHILMLLLYRLANTIDVKPYVRWTRRWWAAMKMRKLGDRLDRWHIRRDLLRNPPLFGPGMGASDVYWQEYRRWLRQITPPDIPPYPKGRPVKVVLHYEDHDELVMLDANGEVIKPGSENFTP